MDAVKPFKVDSKEAHDILDSINTERTAQLKTLTLLQNYGNNHNPVK
jgi:hypothetical protein